MDSPKSSAERNVPTTGMRKLKTVMELTLLCLSRVVQIEKATALRDAI
jgi:hypothetical protein